MFPRNLNTIVLSRCKKIYSTGKKDSLDFRGGHIAFYLATLYWVAVHGQKKEISFVVDAQTREETHYDAQTREAV